MNFCSKCGKQWPEDIRFCPLDGMRLDPEASLPAWQRRTQEITDLESLMGQILNRTYKIETKLGQGGMGAVFRAKHLGIGDTVAIKVLDPNFTYSDEMLARFRREAQTARRLAHPNAVAVHDFNMTEEGLLFMVMEYVEGETIESYLQRHAPIAPQRAVELLRPVAAALDVAHSLGIVHRDLKPANLMLTRNTAGQEQIKVLDFGTARLSENEVLSITKQGQVFGTPLYMSPEQVLGEPSEATADIYSLGVVLYQMLTASLPFVAEKSFHTMIAHLHQTPDPPSKRNSQLTQEIDAIILKALEKVPANRYQSANSLIESLAMLIETPLDLDLSRGYNTLSTKPVSPINTGDQNPQRWDSRQISRTSRLRLAGVKEPDFERYIGREEELHRLQTEYTSSLEGKAHPTFIIGGTGSGKTQLLAQFRTWAENTGALVLFGKFFDYGTTNLVPLRVFKNLIAGLAPNNHDSLAGLNTDERFRRIISIGTETELNDPNVNSEKWQLFDTLTTAFTILAKKAPLILLLDDMQWADSFSLEYLGYLLRNTEGLPICFVGTARAEEIEEKGHPLREWLVSQARYLHHERIELNSFGPDEINTLLQAIFQFIEVGHKDIDTLYQLTSGNPFYLSEIIRMLLENNKITFYNGLWHGANFDLVKLPDSISNIVRYKLEKISSELQELLVQAAIIGDHFSFSLLQQVSQIDEAKLEELLSQAIKVLLVKEESQADQYRFYLTTIRRVVYEDMPQRKRRRLHRQVAEALHKQMGNVAAPLLAYHYHAAAEWLNTKNFSQLALEKAAKQGDTTDKGQIITLTHYAEEALHHLAQETPPAALDDQIAQYKLQRIDALLCLGNFAAVQQEVDHLNQIMANVTNLQLQAQYYLVLTSLCYWGSRYQEGVQVGNQGVTLARQAGEDAALRHTLFYLAWCQARIGPLKDALPTFQEVIALSEQNSDLALQARAMCGFGQLLHYAGQWRQARKILEKSYQIAKKSHDRFVECQTLLMWSWVLEYEGKSEKLHKLVDEGLKVARTWGWRNWEAYLYYVAGRNYSRQNLDLVQAEELLTRSFVIMQETGDKAGELIVTADLAMLSIHTSGNMALERLRTAAALLEKDQETIVQCETLCALGFAEQQLGYHDEAINTLRRACEIAMLIPSFDCQWRIRFGLARALHTMGHLREALSEISLAIEIINRQKQELDSYAEVADYLDNKDHVYAAFAEMCAM